MSWRRNHEAPGRCAPIVLLYGCSHFKVCGVQGDKPIMDGLSYFSQGSGGRVPLPTNVMLKDSI